MLNKIVGHTLSCELKDLGMPLERCAPDVYHIEVFEGVYRREYRQPMIWEVLDWLQKKWGLDIYTYPMTQWRKLAIRKSNSGILVKDMPMPKESTDEEAYLKGISEVVQYIKSLKKL